MGLNVIEGNRKDREILHTLNDIERNLAASEVLLENFFLLIGSTPENKFLSTSHYSELGTKSIMEWFQVFYDKIGDFRKRIEKAISDEKNNIMSCVATHAAYDMFRDAKTIMSRLEATSTMSVFSSDNIHEMFSMIVDIDELLSAIRARLDDVAELSMKLRALTHVAAEKGASLS